MKHVLNLIVAMAGTLTFVVGLFREDTIVAVVGAILLGVGFWREAE